MEKPHNSKTFVLILQVKRQFCGVINFILISQNAKKISFVLIPIDSGGYGLQHMFLRLVMSIATHGASKPVRHCFYSAAAVSLRVDKQKL